MIDLEKAKIFDDIVSRWRKIVVPFFTQKPNNKTAVFGFGSGFIAVYKGEHFLVTAKHVLDDALKHGTCAININDHVLLLQNMYFFTDPHNDIAFTPIEATLFTNKIETVPAIDLTKEGEISKSLGYHLLMGYPASKNILEPRWNKVNRMLYSFTAEVNAAKRSLIKNISDPVVFDFDPHKQLDSSLKPTGQPPHLKGMSGGPALEIRVSGTQEEGYRFCVTLSGVLVEWHEKKRVVVAASTASLMKSLEAAKTKYAKNPVASEH